MKSKKAQISFFIILGIILLGGAIFAFYLTGTQEVQQKNSQQLAQELFKNSDVQRFVQNCLDVSLTNASETIGMQGANILPGEPGNLYSQFPPQIHPKTSSINGINITHLIKKPRSQIETLVCNETGIVYLGDSAMPSLLKTEGAFSIQEQMEKYIQNQTAGCLDFSQFNKQIKAGNITINLTTNDNDISAKMEVQVTIQGNPVTELTSFETSKKIRLKKIYDLTKDIITQDNSMITYNISTDYNQSSFWTTGINLNVQKINEGDLIKIEDSLSSIRGQPYTFQFVSETRQCK